MNYEILASPLLLTLIYLATAPGFARSRGAGRAIFAIGLGVLCAVFQLYASVAMGPYIALLVIVLLTPTLDRAMTPRPLV